MKYQGCGFCSGRGCLACEGELKKAEKRRTERIKQFVPPSEDDLTQIVPHVRSVLCGEASEAKIRAAASTPTPMLTLKWDNPEDMAALKNIFGAEAIRSISDLSQAEFAERVSKQCEDHRVRQQMRGEI